MNALILCEETQLLASFLSFFRGQEQARVAANISWSGLHALSGKSITMMMPFIYDDDADLAETKNILPLYTHLGTPKSYYRGAAGA